MKKIKENLQGYYTVIAFAVFALIAYKISGVSKNVFLSEIVSRFCRNACQVLAMIIPVQAGLGLNFSIVIGAIAGQMAIIHTVSWGITGFPSFLTAVLVSTPIAILFGFLVGKVLNKTKGNEMITSMILGYLANGIYQLIYILLMGTVIPFPAKNMMNISGIGIKSSLGFDNTFKYSLTNIIKIKIGMITIPILPVVCVILLCLFNIWIFRTKLGHDFRAVGQNQQVAAVSGINVDQTRIIAMIFSTVFGAWGQIIRLQDIGTMNTYSAHEQIALLAVAAILVGGATVTRANNRNAIFGVIVFHAMFAVSPQVGKALFNDTQVGEYFRVFLAYGIIFIALAMNAMQQMKAKRRLMLS